MWAGLFLPLLLTVGLTGLLGNSAAVNDPPDRGHTDEPQVQSEPMPEPVFADFRPSRHGFAFVNSFSGSPLPIPLGSLERRLNIPAKFGLCGGMCFAAADFFLAGRRLGDEVAATKPPEGGTPLYQYLYARQAASLGPMAMMFTRFIEWMDLPEGGDDGLHARTMRELDLILPAVEAGEPVMLGLVLVDGAASREVWRNHQVLVYGAVRHDEDQPPMLRIYDPNYPGRDDAVIRWVADEADPRWERHVPRQGEGRRETTRVRGFFKMHYVPADPPDFGP